LAAPIRDPCLDLIVRVPAWIPGLPSVAQEDPRFSANLSEAIGIRPVDKA